MRPNHLFAPFDKVEVRRALMGAIDQRDFMTAAIGADPSLWHVPMGYFPANSPMASDVGLDALTGPRNLDRVAQDLRAAGYSDEKIMLIVPANLWRVRMSSEVAAALLRKVGMTVDEQVMDAATWTRRLASRAPPDLGGWNVYCTSLQGMDALTPANHLALRGNGDQAFDGWPNGPMLEALRDQWLDAPDVAAQRTIAAEIQTKAFIDVPYFPLDQMFA